MFITVTTTYELTSPLHILTMYRPFVAAGAACDSLNLSDLHYITVMTTTTTSSQSEAAGIP